MKFCFVRIIENYDLDFIEVPDAHIFNFDFSYVLKYLLIKIKIYLDH